MTFHVSLRCASAALAVLALVSHGTAEAPESIHRRACFRFHPAQFAQQAWLQATLDHQVPATMSCSSLEGPSCLDGNFLPHRRSLDTGLGSQLEELNGGEAGASKVKLYLLKPQAGQSPTEFLRSVINQGKASVGGATGEDIGTDSATAEALAENGQVVFEGDASSLTDLDAVSDSMMAALGLPASGNMAASVRRQLAKALTDAEFAVEDLKRSGKLGKQAADGKDPDTGKDGEAHRADGSQRQQHWRNRMSKGADSGGAETGGSSRNADSTADGSRAAALRVAGEALLEGLSAEEQRELATSVRQLLDNIRASRGEERASQAASTQQDANAGAGISGGGKPVGTESRGPLDRAAARHRAAKQQRQDSHAALAEPQSAGGSHSGSDSSGGSHAAGAGEIYVDDFGEEFIIDPPAPGEDVTGEEVYIDDVTGNTYTVQHDGDEAATIGNGKGRLTQRLIDNADWLNGLTDDEYDEYMDAYEAEMDEAERRRHEKI